MQQQQQQQPAPPEIPLAAVTRGLFINSGSNGHVFHGTTARRNLRGGAPGDNTQVPVALKTPTWFQTPRNLLTREAQVQSSDLIKEAALLFSINHPNVVVCHGIVMGSYHPADGPPIAVAEYLVMELLTPIGTWRELAAVGSGEQLVRAAQQVFETLGCLHARYILHRDPKPGNILLVEGWQPKLLDMGAGIQMERTFGARSLCGTLMYIAPEINQQPGAARDPARGDVAAPYGAPADVFSAAAIFVTQLVPDLLDAEPGRPASEHYAEVRAVPAATAKSRTQEAVWGLLGRQPVVARMLHLLHPCLDATPANRPSANQCASGLSQLLDSPTAAAPDASNSYLMYCLDEIGNLRDALTNALKHASRISLPGGKSAVTEMLVRMEVSSFSSVPILDLQHVPNLDDDMLGTILGRFSGKGVEQLNLTGQHCLTNRSIAAIESNLVDLRSLDVSHCPGITTIPNARRLIRLLARGSSGVGDAGLATATGIVELDADDNPRITTVAPFAASLRKLTAGGQCGIGDAGLATATGIVELVATSNRKITTVAPFAASLRKLDAQSECGIGDAGLATATGIVELDAANNPRITSRPRR